MDIRSEVKKMKEDSPKMAALSLETRNQALLAVAEALQQQAGRSQRGHPGLGTADSHTAAAERKNL